MADYLLTDTCQTYRGITLRSSRRPTRYAACPRLSLVVSRTRAEMGDQLRNFGETAKGLARNPLGIIALFIVLVYVSALCPETLSR